MRVLGLLLVLCASIAHAQPVIIAAEFAEPTQRYQHGVFGETAEWGTLVIVVDLCPQCARMDKSDRVFRLPETHVFEDIAPRLVDLNGDGAPEVVVVETDMAQGARLAIYDQNGLVTATPYIGQTHRWLAPVGFGDFNDDGQIDIAYVETPHLGRILRMLTLISIPRPHLVEIGHVAGFTNHRFGDAEIWGGVRDCAGETVVIGTNADWSRILVGLVLNGTVMFADAGPLAAPEQLNALLDCDYVNAR